MPGLIDLHVHMESEYNPKKYMDKFTANEADIAFKSVKLRDDVPLSQLFIILTPE